MCRIVLLEAENDEKTNSYALFPGKCSLLYLHSNIYYHYKTITTMPHNMQIDISYILPWHIITFSRKLLITIIYNILITILYLPTKIILEASICFHYIWMINYYSISGKQNSSWNINLLKKIWTFRWSLHNNHTKP